MAWSHHSASQIQHELWLQCLPDACIDFHKDPQKTFHYVLQCREDLKLLLG